MTSECPHCGHHYERESGYWIGAMIINMGVTEALFGVVLAAVVLASWPEVPWVGLLAVGAAMNRRPLRPRAAPGLRREYAGSGGAFPREGL
jgi:hypothetical protein